jgi:hypothetical protein
VNAVSAPVAVPRALDGYPHGVVPFRQLPEGELVRPRAGVAVELSLGARVVVQKRMRHMTDRLSGASSR